MKNNEMTNLI